MAALGTSRGVARDRGGRRRALASALAAAALLAACSSRPRSPAPGAPAPAGAEPSARAEAKPEAHAEAKPSARVEAKPEARVEAKPEAPAEARLGAGPEAAVAARIDAQPSAPAKERADYLEVALSDYWLERLPNGASIAVKRQAGRRTAAARIVLARGPRPEAAEEAGYSALALAAAVGSPAGAEPGSVARAALEAGASLELRLEDYDDVALELVCPGEEARSLLALVARSLAEPAFAPSDFERALREARVAERREAGDPLSRASAELRSGLYAGRPDYLPPRGTAASLAGATLERVMRYWAGSFGARRLSVVVVGDFEPGELARELAAGFGALPPLPVAAAPAGPAARPPAPRLRPWFKAVPLDGTPGQAVLRGEFEAPEPSSPDFPAMTVALAMLDDLLVERLQASAGLAYGAWTGLSPASAPSASLTVYKTGDPAAAKAAADSAIADLARGLCVDASSAAGGLRPVAAGLEAYRARAITAVYAKAASSEGMAARIARDLAAGGDGTSIFRMAERLSAVRAEDVERVARERLLAGPSAWVALGDPALVRGLDPSLFARP